MSNCEVSIIMPFYNTAPFIRESIESIFSQTFEDWELCVVDDGSNDGSSDIARSYTKSQKVRYLHHEGHRNLGASAARNLGLQHAKGKFIAFLDSDDVYLPNKLKEQLQILKSHPDAGCLYGSTEYWFSWTGRAEDLNRDYQVPLGLPLDTLFEPPVLFHPFFITQEITTPCTCSLMVRREVIDRTGAFEESFRAVYTDQVFYVKLSLATPIFVTSGCWDRYRQHPDSNCKIMEETGQQYAARYFFLNWLEQYLEALNVNDKRMIYEVQKTKAIVKNQMDEQHMTPGKLQ